MLQVRAGHCPNCKESTPPGADFCPICGEDLSWQTTDGQKILSRSTPAPRKSAAFNLIWGLICLLLTYLLAALILTAIFGGHPADVEPPDELSIAKPEAADNSISNSVDANTDNTATNAANNSVSNNVDNAASNNASTPESEATPKSDSAPKPDEADDLSNLDLP